MGLSAVRVTAPAKVNLHLSVGPLRGDGYHDVVTVLQALELADVVTITREGAFSFACDRDVGVPDEENLAVRAARALAGRLGRALDVRVVLEKRTPAAAGLGGASADAAAVLCGLAALWGERADSPVVSEAARSLGADVPFFLYGGAALFSGRGDVFERRVSPLRAPIVLVKPDVSVSTSAAYAAFDELGPATRTSPEALIAALEAQDPRQVAALLYNNLAPAALRLAPDVGRALDVVRGAPDVLGATVAGSGSAVFGICGSPESADRVARAAVGSGLWACATFGSEHGCVVEALA